MEISSLGDSDAIEINIRETEIRRAIEHHREHQ